MRLKRFDLTRFGRFTDHTIDFGERPLGAPDLHIVYGPNEAGKSTALAAFLDLLFGIAPQSRFNFLHPYPTMRIGATLELDGAAREFVRIKRPQNSLLDGHGQPLSDGAILRELGGIDRAAYQTMFSLDDETLEAGGESILASKGDLGQLLFAASAGLADLSRSLVDLRADADRFYKYRARGGELVDLKGRLAGLKADRERIDTLAAHYAQLVETRDRAAIQYDEAMRQRGEIQARMDEIQRFLNALPRLRTLRDIQARLRPLADLPRAPSGWAADLPALQKDDIALAIQAKGLEDEIDRLTADLASIVTDKTAIGLADRADRLADMRARYVTAAKDIPERRLQMREAALAVAGILERIERKGEPDPSRLILGASVVGVLRGLIETRSGVEAALATAREEVFKAQALLAAARDRLGTSGDNEESGRAMAAVSSTMAALHTDDHAARRRLAARALADHAATLADRLRALRPWDGDGDQLADMAVPDARIIAAWKAAANEAQKEIDRHKGQVERLTTDSIRLSAEANAAGLVAGLVDDREANAVRTARDAAWTVHRQMLDVSSAETFETALHRDDAVTDARLKHGAERATLHHTARKRIVLDADLARARQLLAAAEAALRSIRDALAEAVRAMTPALPETIALPQLEDWLGRRVQALDERSAFLADARDLHQAETDAATARQRLLRVLESARIAHPAEADLDTLMMIARTAVDQEAGRKASREAVEDRRRDLKTRERDLQKASEADEAWTAAWAKACAACWLGQGDALPSLATVREIIVALSGLGPAIEKQAGLADRIAKMENDQAAFTAEVQAIASALDLTATTGAILDLAQAVTLSIRGALSAQGDHDIKAKALDDLWERQRAHAGKQAIHAVRKTEMTAHFGVETLSEVADKLRSADTKADLEAQAGDVTREILEALRLPTMDEAEQALDTADHTALEAEQAAQKARFDDQDRRGRDLFATYVKAVDQVEAVGGDEAVARIEEQRRTTLLDIEDKALRYLKLRAGATAAEQALRAYRDRHRSAMMARASDAFRTISRAAYRGLATQPDRESEILVAVGADGGSKVAHELSKGTRFQLYLALRVAGYHEFVRARPPVPFIADDIMETFDDFRAEETFRLLGGMAEAGQVIYLTHHRHLCEIACRIRPGTRIHSLIE